MSDKPTFSTHFDEEAFAEDLAHSTQAGRQVAQAERARIQRDGIPASELLPVIPRRGTAPAWVGA